MAYGHKLNVPLGQQAEKGTYEVGVALRIPERVVVWRRHRVKRQSMVCIIVGDGQGLSQHRKQRPVEDDVGILISSLSC